MAYLPGIAGSESVAVIADGVVNCGSILSGALLV